MIDRLFMPTPGEVDVYQGYATQLLSGLAPYRDYWFEYPPGLLPIAVIPKLITSNPDAYFAVWVLMIAVAVGVSTWMIGQSRLKTTKGFAGMTFLAMCMAAGIFLTHRYDIFVACIVLWGVIAYRKGNTSLSMALMVLGAFTKLYPALFIPLLFIYTPKKWAKLLATLVLTSTPFLYVWGPGIPRFLEFHGQKPVQIESVQGMLYRDTPIVYERFSYVYEDTKSNPYIQYGLVIGVLGMIAHQAIKKPRTMQFEIACMMMLSAFLIGGNIFSPQYMLWFASFIPFVSFPLALNFIGMTWLTSFYFRYYEAITLKLEPESLLLAIRNVWLVTVFIKMIRRTIA